MARILGDDISCDALVQQMMGMLLAWSLFLLFLFGHFGV